MPELTLRITVSDEDLARLKALGKPQHRTITGQAEYLCEQWLPRALKQLLKGSANGRRPSPPEDERPASEVHHG
jgi:hypothetical protein